MSAHLAEILRAAGYLGIGALVFATAMWAFDHR
jgi:hypothetical protein